MALVLGTNCGFVTEAPIGDPAVASTTRDGYAGAMKVVTGVGVTKVTEIGWWSSNYSEAANFEVGLYSHDAGNDKPNERLYVDDTNAKGTAAGWKVVTVDWDVDAETTYWLAYQIDPTATATKIDYETTGGLRVSFFAAATLPATWGASNETASYLNAIYAVAVAGTTYSELSGTIASTSAVENADLAVSTYSSMSGTIAAASVVEPASLGQTAVNVIESVAYTRLVALGNDRFYYEDI